MRTFILIILSLFLFAFIGNKPKNDLEKQNLKGKVKSVIESTFFAKAGMFGKLQKDGLMDKYKYVFNNAGEETERIKYDTTSNRDVPIETIIYKYDSNDNLIERYDKRGDSIVFKYDNSKHVIEEENFDSNKLVYKVTYKYDDRGNKIEKREYSHENKLESSKVYKFDRSGNETEAYNHYFNIQGTSDSRVTYKYDNRNNKIEKDSYEPDSVLKWKGTYKYDDSGHVIEDGSYHYNRDKTLTDQMADCTNKYKHDEKGNIIEKIYTNKSTGLSYKSTFKFDARGNLIEFCKYNDKGKLIESEKSRYTYDEVGNWVKEIDIENGEPLSITERQIEYYP